MSGHIPDICPLNGYLNKYLVVYWIMDIWRNIYPLTRYLDLYLTVYRISVGLDLISVRIPDMEAVKISGVCQKLSM